MLVHVADALMRIVFAPACAGCHRVLPHPLSSIVCDACWRSVARISAPLCVRCGDALPSSADAGPECARCRARAPSFALARSFGRYDGALREILHAFKYQGRRALAVPLGARLRDACADVLAGADAVVPVPLHPWRRLRRGFNQADDLARELGLPVWRGLRRTDHGPPQASLPAARRHANVRGAFRARAARAPYRVVVVVDDVLTTGATMDACARALRDAGVRSVRALTVARAVTSPPGSPRSPPDPDPARRQ